MTLKYWNTRRFCSKSCVNKSRTGKPMLEETKRKIAIANKGKKNALGCTRTLEWREKQSKYWTNNPKHNHWKDGKAKERRGKRRTEMERLEYRLWRETIFKRDNFTCNICQKRGGNLCADHIKPYCSYPELRLDINNGRTLCIECHRKTETYGIKALNYKVDIINHEQ